MAGSEATTRKTRVDRRYYTPPTVIRRVDGVLVVRKHNVKLYSGSAEAILATGLVAADMLPGQPGVPLTGVCYYPLGVEQRDYSHRIPGRMEIRRQASGRIQVALTVSLEEQIRRDEEEQCKPEAPSVPKCGEVQLSALRPVTRRYFDGAASIAVSATEHGIAGLRISGVVTSSVALSAFTHLAAAVTRCQPLGLILDFRLAALAVDVHSIAQVEDLVLTQSSRIPAALLVSPDWRNTWREYAWSRALHDGLLRGVIQNPKEDAASWISRHAWVLASESPLRAYRTSEADLNSSAQRVLESLCTTTA
ncbi:MAG: hypothetical protein LKCHEGNO_01618 [Burkholderiaceae bacterium]|nr:hypothetical protein [Burkholderiaceae bacterium]